MEDKQYKIIIALMMLLVIFILLGTVALPRYENSIANKVVLNIAQQQTQTGNILVFLNNTLQTMPIQEICGSVK